MNGALNGRTVAITRKKSDASEFVELVEAEGGKTIALPTIEIVPQSPDAARRFMEEIRLKKHEYCAFMSVQAVDVLSGMAGRDEILESLGGTAVIAVGPKTQSKLEELGIKVGLMPPKFSSRGLVEMLSGMDPGGKKIIIPRSTAAGEYAAESLRTLGMQVDEVMLYSVKTSRPSKDWDEFVQLLDRGAIDAVIFTSASSVGAFFEILGSVTQGTDGNRNREIDKLSKVISIGPFTSEELGRRKVECFEAHEHTVRGAFDLAKSLLVSK